MSPVPQPADAPPLPWRRALVVGLGRSGLAAATLLRALGVSVRGYDAAATRDDRPADLEVFLGEPLPPEAAFEGVDLLVLSPGVPPRAIRERAQQLCPGIAVHGELSLALHLVHSDPRWTAVPTVLITGTNGKSTVTALTGALLEAGGRHPFVGGNLGIPLCERLHHSLTGEEPWCDGLVIECSSYQLETLPPTPTAAAMIINVTPDHLDRYDSMEHYARTKARVFAGLGAGDLALLDDADAWTDRLTPTTGEPGPIVRRVGAEAVAWIEGDGASAQLVLGGRDDGGEPAELERYPRSSLRIAGGHNARNALFALLTARHLGVSAQACRRGLETFEGLPHRMVLVRELDGIAYYNDSKATNVASTLAGLAGFERPFVLLAGGLSKGDDLAPLRAVLAARGRGLVAMGDSAEQFAAMADGIVPVERAADMEQAVAKARALAGPGEAVVLSPACASFDQYRSYAQRGEVFTAIVRALT